MIWDSVVELERCMCTECSGPVALGGSSIAAVDSHLPNRMHKAHASCFSDFEPLRFGMSAKSGTFCTICHAYDLGRKSASPTTPNRRTADEIAFQAIAHQMQHTGEPRVTEVQLARRKRTGGDEGGRWADGRRAVERRARSPRAARREGVRRRLIARLPWGRTFGAY